MVGFPVFIKGDVYAKQIVNSSAMKLGLGWWFILYTNPWYMAYIMTFIIMGWLCSRLIWVQGNLCTLFTFSFIVCWRHTLTSDTLCCSEQSVTGTTVTILTWQRKRNEPNLEDNSFKPCLDFLQTKLAFGGKKKIRGHFSKKDFLNVIAMFGLNSLDKRHHTNLLYFRGIRANWTSINL